MASLLLGGGREKKEDAVDPIVGIRVDKKVGDRVQEGDLLGVLYANDPVKAEAAKERFLGAYRFTEETVPPVAPIYGYVDDNGVHSGTI